MERSITEIYDEIKYNFNHSNYIETLTALEEYFSLKDAGITENLLYYYIKTLANLNRIDEALKYLELMIKLFPKSYSYEHYIHEKAMIYLLGNEINKAQELLESIDGKYDEKRYYYDLGRIYLNKAQYEKAKKYFNKCITKKGEKKLNNLSKDNIDKIKRYLHDGTFIEINYQTFKEKGFNLKPRHVVYASKVESMDSSSVPASYKQSKIPYLIWKIEGNRYYAFPVTNKKKTIYAHMLKASDYPNFNFDRTIKDQLVCIDENNIKQVIDEIKEDDFYSLLDFMYRNKYFLYLKGLIGNDDLYLNMKMQEYNIQKNDVLVIYDKDERKNIYYYIYEEDNEKYYAVEVDSDSTTIKSLDTKEFDKSEIMFRVLKLSDEQKEKVISQLSANYQKIKRY